jgi:uncharacterized protein (TIGR03435 family)
MRVMLIPAISGITYRQIPVAAVQSQTGLRLVPRKNPVPVLIVVHAEKVPLEN